MSAEMLRAFDYALDRITKARKPEPKGFLELTPEAQRFAICEHMRTNEWDLGLFGESINEHSLFAQYVTAFKLGDTAEMGRLADIMTREYLASVIEREWK